MWKVTRRLDDPWGQSPRLGFRRPCVSGWGGPDGSVALQTLRRELVHQLSPFGFDHGSHLIRECGRCLRLRASIRRRFIRSRRCYPRLAVSLFPCYRPHTEALGVPAQILSVSRWFWRYRVATKSASKAARITQMLRRIVRNLWRRALGAASRSSNVNWLHGLEFRFESRKSIEIKFASISSDFSSVIAIVHYQNSNHVHFLFMRRPATSLTHNGM